MCMVAVTRTLPLIVADLCNGAMAYFALAVVVCFVASGKTSLYSVQTNLYSRLEKKAED